VPPFVDRSTVSREVGDGVTGRTTDFGLENERVSRRHDARVGAGAKLACHPNISIFRGCAP
jgi:hypothetical protein